MSNNQTQSQKEIEKLHIYAMFSLGVGWSFWSYQWNGTFSTEYYFISATSELILCTPMQMCIYILIKKKSIDNVQTLAFMVWCAELHTNRAPIFGGLRPEI